jgi:hypothetical protein
MAWTTLCEGCEGFSIYAREINDDFGQPETMNFIHYARENPRNPRKTLTCH